MLGIIIGVASVISIITIGNGGRDYIIGMIKDMGGATAVNITVKSRNAEPSDYITSDDIRAIKSTIGEVRYISPIVFAMGGIKTTDNSGLGFTIGGTVDLESILNSATKYGRFFTEEEYLSRKPVAVIDAASSIMLFGYENSVGETITYTYEGMSVTFKIIGVMSFMDAFGGGDTEQMMASMEALGGGADAPISSSMMLIPASVSIEILGTQERYESVYIMASDDTLLDSTGEAALNILYARHNNYDRDVYAVTNMASFVDLLDTVITVFTLFIAAVSAISLLVGGIGVMNIMLVSVTERTREIGIRKALGARTRTILFQFLTESIIICLIGGLVGLLGGFAIASVVSYIMEVPLSVKLTTVLLAIGFSSAIGIFFGIYPAKRAADLPPIEALRRD